MAAWVSSTLEASQECVFEGKGKWFQHEPDIVIESEDYKVLWEFSIQIDHVTEAQRLDLVAVDKKNKVSKSFSLLLLGM